jgi:nicotinate-nucleotide pyrophosphorylase (carboxylating)
MKTLDSLQDRIQQVLSEDHVESDLATQKLEEFLGDNPELNFEIVAKEPLVFCARRWVQAFADLGFFKILKLAQDGERVSAGAKVLVARSTLCGTLSFERSLLNGMQRWSGVATLTRECVATVERVCGQWNSRDRELWPKPQILHTRKTTPLWRDLEIEAVLAGGGHPHRRSLAERPMVKENHKEPVLKMRGEWSSYLEKVLSVYPEAVIEAETWTEASTALRIGAKCLLLDNFSPKQIRENLGTFLEEHGGKSMPAIEVSGGIHPGNLEEYVIPGVSRISMGALTHSYRSVDLSLNLLLENAKS